MNKILSKTHKGIVMLMMLATGGICGGVMSSCSDYLEIYPENQLPVDKFWASKDDVSSALNSSYYYLAEATEGQLIPWGELRSSVLTTRGSHPFQTWQIKSTDGRTSWATMYKIVNIANLVLSNAEKALGSDRTYTQEELNSHHCEAYFQRALAYFYIVRNWNNAPLITIPYETDKTPLKISCSPAADIISQIKADLEKAIELGAAKEKWDTKWETKGKATIWSIYALMADVCMYNQDFDEAIKYCDLILNDKTGRAPHFMSTPTHASWFSMFNPGNSDESIFELQWNRTTLKADGVSYQTNNLPNIFIDDESGTYMLSEKAYQDFEYDRAYCVTQHQAFADNEAYVRTYYGSYTVSGTNAYVFKYNGNTTFGEKRSVNYYDPNFILYRVADIMLLKAEALIMRTGGQDTADKQLAIDIVNEVRTRTNLDSRIITEDTDLQTLIDYVLTERIMELLGEGKSWYDFLRISRYKDPSGIVDFKSFIISKIIEYNRKAKESWVKSVLLDDNAWFLPIYNNEIKNNGSLVQNPYYQ